MIEHKPTNKKSIIIIKINKPVSDDFLLVVDGPPLPCRNKTNHTGCLDKHRNNIQTDSPYYQLSISDSSKNIELKAYRFLVNFNIIWKPKDIKILKSWNLLILCLQINLKILVFWDALYIIWDATNRQKEDFRFGEISRIFDYFEIVSQMYSFEEVLDDFHSFWVEFIIPWRNEQTNFFQNKACSLPEYSHTL